jgi:hypothetical protein
MKAVEGVPGWLDIEVSTVNEKSVETPVTLNVHPPAAPPDIYVKPGTATPSSKISMLAAVSGPACAEDAKSKDASAATPRNSRFALRRSVVAKATEQHKETRFTSKPSQLRKRRLRGQILSCKRCKVAHPWQGPTPKYARPLKSPVGRLSSKNVKLDKIFGGISR